MTRTSKLADVKCFLLDMDGTFYLGSQLLPGALEFIHLLNQRGIQYHFLTNNSSRTAKNTPIRSAGWGWIYQKARSFTSGEATAIYLAQRKPGAILYVVGTPTLEREFREHGFQLSSEQPDFVVLGFDTTLTYEKIWKLCDLVVSGVPLSPPIPISTAQPKQVLCQILAPCWR